MLLFCFQHKKAQFDSQRLTDFRNLVKQGRQEFKKELESIVPAVRMTTTRGEFNYRKGMRSTIENG